MSNAEIKLSMERLTNNFEMKKNKLVELCKEIGPKGLFNAWGYPKVVKLSKKLLDQEKQIKIIDFYQSIKK